MTAPLVTAVLLAAVAAWLAVSRIRLGRELRRSRDAFEALVTGAPVGILQADAAGMCTFANRRWCEMTGFDEIDTLGHAWSKTVHPDDLAGTMAAWEASVRSGRRYVNALRLVHGRGHVIHVIATAAPLVDESGTLVGFIGTVLDITEQQVVRDALEEERTFLRRHLELQEQERHLLCNEFHDGLIQGAVGAKMLLEACRHDAAAPLPRSAVDAVDAAIDALARGIEDGRRVIRGIRPALLDDLGLAAAVDDLVGQLAPHGVGATSSVAADLGTLPNALQITAYRIVQEALANCLRHSGAREVRVAIERRGDDVLIEIADDGHGFDPTAARRRGFGLLGMEERARLAGGSCRVTSGDTGTRVQVRLPLAAAEAAAAAG